MNCPSLSVESPTCWHRCLIMTMAIYSLLCWQLWEEGAVSNHGPFSGFQNAVVHGDGDPGVVALRVNLQGWGTVSKWAVQEDSGCTLPLYSQDMWKQMKERISARAWGWKAGRPMFGLNLGELSQSAAIAQESACWWQMWVWIRETWAHVQTCENMRWASTLSVYVLITSA